MLLLKKNFVVEVIVSKKLEYEHYQTKEVELWHISSKKVLRNEVWEMVSQPWRKNNDMIVFINQNDCVICLRLSEIMTMLLWRNKHSYTVNTNKTSKQKSTIKHLVFIINFTWQSFLNFLGMKVFKRLFTLKINFF